MKQDIKERWIDALLSGKYKQGRGTLRRPGGDGGELTDEDEFCCLGVLCEVAAEDGVVAPKLDEARWAIYETPDGLSSAEAILPSAVAKWADVTTHGDYDVAGVNRCLTQDNDEAQKSFEEIAEIIRERF